MTAKDYLSGREAAAFLDVKPATLYAYVSRGLIRSVPSNVNPRRKIRQYLLEDLEKVKMRADARHGHGPVAAEALRWGQPVMKSSITEITPDGPRYRGQLATDLARNTNRGAASFEAVAELLWSGVLPSGAPVWVPPRVGGGREVLAMLASIRPHTPVLTMMALAMGMLGSDPAEQNELSEGTTLLSARRAVQTLVSCLGYLRDKPVWVSAIEGKGIAESALLALDAEVSDERVSAVNRMLILCADHELSTATFAGRVAASTSASLHASLSAALAAYGGREAGLTCDAEEEFLDNLGSKDDISAQIMRAQASRTKIPGFNIRAYPHGDPRALMLLEIARAAAPDSKRLQLIAELVKQAERSLNSTPSLQTGVIALCFALNLPRQSASALWAVGRSAGWVAHVIEQRLQGAALRPRAQFV